MLKPPLTEETWVPDKFIIEYSLDISKILKRNENMSMSLFLNINIPSECMISSRLLYQQFHET